jgi:hypothetical protein
LTDTIWKYADKNGLFEPYEFVLAEYQELMRLAHGDNMGIRNFAPFAWLNLGKDDDCYNFIKWWVEIDSEGNYDWGEPPQSREGDWLYLTGQDKMEYLETVQDDLTTLVKHKSAFTLERTIMMFCSQVALIAIKVNIIDDLETKISEYEAFTSALDKNSEDSALRKVRTTDLVMDDIKTKIFGSKMRHPEQVLEEQKEHLKSYLSHTKKANVTMLPALLNPKPLLAEPEPMSYGNGSVAEVANILRFAASYFLRHHSAQKAIRKFLYPELDLDAPLPVYECGISAPYYDVY